MVKRTLEYLQHLDGRDIIYFAKDGSTLRGKLTDVKPSEIPSCIGTGNFDYEKTFTIETSNGKEKRSVKQFEKNFQFYEDDHVCSEAEAKMIGLIALCFGRALEEDPKYAIMEAEKMMKTEKEARVTAQ